METIRREDAEKLLGCKVQDTITGLTGVAIAVTRWLNGCVRVCIQPQEVRDGKPAEGYTVDVEQVRLVSHAGADQLIKASGGPMPDVPRSRDPI